MNIRKILQNIIAPSPLSTGSNPGRTLMWNGQHGDYQSNQALVDLVLRAASEAKEIQLPVLDERCQNKMHQIWPGEHYRILAALIRLQQPKNIVEFGTCAGISALAMLQEMSPDAVLSTFDLFKFDAFPDNALKESDFEDGRLVQHLDNLANREEFEKHRSLIEKADFLFLDGPKDGKTEPKLVENLSTVKFQKTPIVVFDDIHNFKMLGLWQQLPYPKFDMTSLGHWTGTGIVEWVQES